MQLMMSVHTINNCSGMPRTTGLMHCKLLDDILSSSLTLIFEAFLCFASSLLKRAKLNTDAYHSYAVKLHYMFNLPGPRRAIYSVSHQAHMSFAWLSSEPEVTSCM